jgi:hypothetical protein
VLTGDRGEDDVGNSGDIVNVDIADDSGENILKYNKILSILI